MNAGVYGSETMLLFKLVRLTRKIRTWLSGNKPWEERFKLFELEEYLSPERLYEKLIPYCYQYNYMSATYRHQMFTVRKLTDIRHQIHLRFYRNGWVTGHFELQPEIDPGGHLKGNDLRELDDEEKARIERILK